MNTYINKAKELALEALNDVSVNGQNGALSAGDGGFNSLCGAVALRTGLSFKLATQVLYPMWDEFFEFKNVQGLETFDNWHNWKV